MKIEIPIIVGFDDMESLLDDLKKLQTYKLFEGDEKILVDIDDVADVLAKHIKAKEKQPEIIRCKDCKYARLTYDGDCKYCDIWSPDDAVYLDGDYYCASAERRDNA